MWIRETEFKICLYADDLLITLSQPDLSLKKWLSHLTTFGLYSGYKLNIHKTQLILYNYTHSSHLKNLYNFSWDSNTIKYLGVKIPKDLTNIYNLNYVPMTKGIKEDFNRWTLQPFNLHNHIDIIKMNILPRLLFLFQSIPIAIPIKQFTEWKRMFSGFIWKGLKPRVRYKTLQLPKEEGGALFAKYGELL